MFVSFYFSLILAWLVPFNASASYRGPSHRIGYHLLHRRGSRSQSESLAVRGVVVCRMYGPVERQQSKLFWVRPDPFGRDRAVVN